MTNFSLPAFEMVKKLANKIYFQITILCLPITVTKNQKVSDSIEKTSPIILYAKYNKYKKDLEQERKIKNKTTINNTSLSKSQVTIS